MIVSTHKFSFLVHSLEINIALFHHEFQTWSVNRKRIHIFFTGDSGTRSHFCFKVLGRAPRRWQDGG